MKPLTEFITEGLLKNMNEAAYVEEMSKKYAAG